MDRQYLKKALARYAVMGLVVAAVLVLGSGRWDWTRAWLYVALTVSAQAVVGVVVERVSPGLLAERARFPKDSEWWDKVLAPVVAAVGPLAMWGTAAWEARRAWPLGIPWMWSLMGISLCVVSMVFAAWAMVSNRFFASTVRIQTERGHMVVDGGPYRYVRHPGYAGALAFTLATPLALGSWWALWPAVFTVVALVVRTGLEDRLLQARLDGYAEYAGRVRNRLVPWVW
ncbi:MAG: isoprenylcysteine carboxylmethyltransferase family protein [Acidobacteria bacterium]|nr:isoprenylcysteine carboxylmethyltransferase family protein [Acidobacteriota bacterium]